MLGLLLTLVLRRRSAATRNLVLRTTLAVACALPLVASIAPRLEVATPDVPLPSVLPISSLPRTVPTPTPVIQDWSIKADSSTVPPSYDLARRTPLGATRVPLPLVVLFAWLGGTGLLVLRWLLGLVRLARLRRRGVPTAEPDVWRTAIGVPATYGRTILVPLAASSWPETRLRAAVLHERAHVARGDWHWQTFAFLFAALHWPNPAVWLLTRLLRDTAEAAADDGAIAHMAPSDYARELLAVAKSVGSVGPALAMARRGGVRDRIVAVLASGRDRRHPTRLATLCSLAFALCGLALAAVRIHVPNGDDVHRLKSGAKVRLLSLRALETLPQRSKRSLKAGRPVWSVDGRRVWTSTENFPVVRPAPKGFRTVMLTGLIEGSDTPAVAKVMPWESHSRTVFGYPSKATGPQSLRVAWYVPETLDRQDLRLAIASGPWTRYTGPDVSFKASRRALSTKSGVSVPGVWMEFPYPSALTGRNVRMSAVLRDGRKVGVGAFNMGPEPERRSHPALVTMSAQIEREEPKDVTRIDFEYRDYETVTFPDVALRPSTLPSASLSSDVGLEGVTHLGARVLERRA